MPWLLLSVQGRGLALDAVQSMICSPTACSPDMGGVEAGKALNLQVQGTAG